MELLLPCDGLSVVVYQYTACLVYDGVGVPPQIRNECISLEQSCGDGKCDGVSIQIDIMQVPKSSVCFISEGQNYRDRCVQLG